MTRWSAATAIAALALLATAPAGASTGVATPEAPSVSGGRHAALLDEFGGHHHPISTRSAAAQRSFDRGLELAYAFDHEAAMRSFEEAGRIDPASAMAWWGVALSLGPRPGEPMAEADVPRAWQAIQKARALAPSANEKERAYVAALEARYAPSPDADRHALDVAYADAMRDLARSYPEDLDAATLFAEALLDTMPSRYWTADLEPLPATREVLETLETVLARDPHHPGANRLYVHAIAAGHPKIARPVRRGFGA